MGVFENIGLGVFILSIVSVVYWSPRQYSILHNSSALDRIPEGKAKIWEKNKNLPLIGDLAVDKGEQSTEDKLEDFDKDSPTQNYNTFEKMKPKKYSSVERGTEHKYDNEALESSDIVDISSKDLKDTTSFQSTRPDKQTSQSAASYVKGKAAHIIDTSEDVVERTDEWIADHTHDVFDKTSAIANTAENVVDEAVCKTHDAIDKALTETSKKMDLKKSMGFSNDKDSNVIEPLEENSNHQDNLPHCHQNKRYYEDTTKHYYEVKEQQKPPQDNCYDDTNYEGIKDESRKYCTNLKNKMDNMYNKENLNNYYDSAYRYSEENYNDAKNKVGQYYEGIKTGFEGAKVGAKVGTLYGGLPKTYEGAKIGAQIGYNIGEEIQGKKNNIQHYYDKAKYKSSEGYLKSKNAINNNLQRMGEKLHCIEANIVDNGNDEEYNGFDNNRQVCHRQN